MNTLETSVTAILDRIRTAADAAGVFGALELSGNTLRCRARESAEEAWYVVESTPAAITVALTTADRWLSESIEADLMHYGDPIEELIEEELVELGWSGPSPTVKHYRSDDMLYTFISVVPTSGTEQERADAASTWLLAYEAAFRELGDMTADEE